jgi:hypothetical protein
MNRFLLRLLVFSIFPLMTLYGIFLLDNGTADPFYRRVIGGKKKSLVIGTSKAAQGIVPSVLNAKLGLAEENELYNFSFTNIHSPFGESYNYAIQKKLFEDIKDGIFIVTVDPWSISAAKSAPNDRLMMEDDKLFLGKLSSFSSPINLEYLLRFYINSYYEIPLRYFANNTMTLTEDGWLMATPLIEQKRYSRFYESKVNEYKERANRVKFSEYRFYRFTSLIDFLKKKGAVYVIVMPIDEKFYVIEKSVLPEMVNQLEQFCKSSGIPFKDFSSDNSSYKFVDGVHLDYKTASVFSNDLANWILEVGNNN